MGQSDGRTERTIFNPTMDPVGPTPQPVHPSVADPVHLPIEPPLPSRNVPRMEHPNVVSVLKVPRNAMITVPATGQSGVPRYHTVPGHQCSTNLNCTAPKNHRNCSSLCIREGNANMLFVVGLLRLVSRVIF